MFTWLKTLFAPAPEQPQKPLPQLEMIRDHLDNLPKIRIPEGYAVRTYQPGDEAAWCAIMEGNLGKHWTVEKCREKIIRDPRFQPENLIFATCDGHPVASVCAWSSDKAGPTTGIIHMVAALETHRGKGLGHLLNALVLYRLRALGYEKACLLTDDWRLAAVKTYLIAGFRPLNTHASHPERWEAIFAKLGIEK